MSDDSVLQSMSHTFYKVIECQLSY